MEDLLTARVKVETTDVQLLLLSKKEVAPEQLEWSPGLEQGDPHELPQIKEEQEELLAGQEGRQLQGLEEADITKFTPTPVPVKSEEDDEEQPQSSQLHHAEEMKAEADGEDCGRPEPDRNFSPDSHLQTETDDETSHSPDPETDDSCDWEESLRNNEELGCNFGKTSAGSSECSTSVGCQQEQTGSETGMKRFSCSVCGKKYRWKRSLTAHMRIHSEGKSFTCTVCQKIFPFRANFMRHMRIHTGEKPFSCSACDTKFTRQEHLKLHMRIHAGEKPYICSVCSRGFTVGGTLRRHMRTHTGEKPFSCSVCDQSFTHLTTLKTHKCVGDSMVTYMKLQRCSFNRFFPAVLKD